MLNSLFTVTKKTDVGQTLTLNCEANSKHKQLH